MLGLVSAPSLALLPLVLGGGENLLENGSIEGPRGWTHTGGGEAAELEIDRKEGAAAKGSLRIRYPADGDGTPHNWRQTIELPEKDRPARLELSGMVRVRGAREGSEACIMVQLLPESGQPIGYGRCPEVREDCDWKRVDTVLEVPEGVERVFLMAYYLGPGTCWFDDLSLVATDRPATDRSFPVVPRQDSRHEELARGAAADLGWSFDAESAFARARDGERPILLYVRCTDDKEHLDSALSSVAAPEVRFQDDGYAKDVLFRAGPLSDPDVRALVERRFVPVCLTYVLGDHTYGAETPPDWGATPGGSTTRFESSAIEGHARPGCLSIVNEDPDDRSPHNWNQALDPPAELPAVLELAASIRAEGFARGSEATVMIQCWKGDEAVAYGRVQEVLKDTGWKRQSARFSVPAGTDKIRVLAYLVGQGRVWFDDLSIRDPDAPELEYVRNGGLDRLSPGGLGGFDVSPRDVTTPALVAVDADGRVVAKLHRFGALSSELVDRWLRGVLDELGRASDARDAGELFLDGEPERVLEAASGSVDDRMQLLAARAMRRLGELDRARAALRSMRGPEAALERGILALRAGDWEAAREELAPAIEARDLERVEEARFWDAFCLERLGEHAKARELWTELAGESLFGRRAAACLLIGPRLPLALSERAWPATDELPVETEVGTPDAFDPVQSITALLELQRAGGSFGGHMGPDGMGFVEPAITAIAMEALRAWEPRSPTPLRARMKAARARALAYLEGWSERPAPGSDAFNLPYVLTTLLEEGSREAAQRVVARIEETQLPDGNWTVYDPERPASFNTALAVMALARAKKERLEVTASVLKRGVEALAAMRQDGGLFPYSTADGHEWMTTEHGSIARDPLCEHALLVNGEGDKKALSAALERYARFAHELRIPTKRLYDYFNSRGHGGYYFFFAHRNAAEAAALVKGDDRKRALAIARDSVLRAREGDGTFVDQFMLGRAYGTAMALIVLATAD